MFYTIFKRNKATQSKSDHIYELAIRFERKHMKYHMNVMILIRAALIRTPNLIFFLFVT